MSRLEAAEQAAADKESPETELRPAPDQTLPSSAELRHEMRELVKAQADEITALRAKVEQAARDEVELRRVYEAEIDSAFRADVIGCGWLPPIKVILTVAHLNHDPTDNRMENLRHWCQKCHNSYDAAHRAANRKRRLTESKPPG